ncbi:MAG: hypothetical protein A2Y96_02795 [Firmicutes bacterium RBG_13_65_8]|nr:MAG: hypothetical protein A2Y96_02795 [Firmicutes bacterium RBG_13_65_8]
MLDDIVVVGLTMIIVQLLKRPLKRWVGDDLGHQLTPLVVLGLAGGLNVLNAYLFGLGMAPLTSALAEGIKLGAMSGGIYSMGRAALGIQ